MNQDRKFSDLDIAIIGIACRFPGANNWREYWHNLIHGVESIRILSDQELDKYEMEESKRKDKRFVKAVSSLQGKEYFDHNFFDYRHEEAELMNPQHRIFHECAWEAFEDAACDPALAKGQVGVFAGAGQDLSWQVHTSISDDQQIIDGFTLSQINNKDFLASLLAYKLNLNGPTFTINTACSTSAVAVHLACRSLLLGECSMALAGGISLFADRTKGYYYQEGMIFSYDGHCRAFDKDASGTVVGEGVGLVVLKRLKDALNENDHIYAIVNGSAINNDGNRKVGYSAPSIDGQADCIRAALKFARVSPDSIGYIETHGTGTKLGDPIEIAALKAGYSGRNGQRCPIGSVKTNIGHLDSAAGIAGLIKTALCLHFKKIPQSLHFKEANPEIDFNNSPFYVNTALQDWNPPHPEGRRRAGVSSFGIGGTNAHIILEEFPKNDNSASAPRYEILTLSSKTQDALKRNVQRLLSYLQTNLDTNLQHLCYTLHVGRRKFNYRKSFVFKNREDLLRKFNRQNDFEVTLSKNQQVCFIFSEEGLITDDLGKDLYRHETIFRDEMDKGLSILLDLTGEDFKTLLFSKNQKPVIVERRAHFRPLLFLLEYALARLIISYGISPQSTMAYGNGELIAACISEVFSLQDALRMLLSREIDSQMPSIAQAPHSMLLENNNQSSVTGRQFLRIAESNLKMKISSSSARLTTFRNISYKKPKYTYYTNTGLVSSDDLTTPEYWGKFLSQNTDSFFSDIENVLLKNRNFVYCEMGPASFENWFTKHDIHSVTVFGKTREIADEQKVLYNAIGELWEYCDINLSSLLYKDKFPKKISLPTYAFTPVKFLAEVKTPDVLARLQRLNVKRKKPYLHDWFYHAVWKQSRWLPGNEIALADQPVLLFCEPDCTRTITEMFKSVVLVHKRDLFVKGTDTNFFIDPNNENDYFELFRQLKRGKMNPSRIIHFWSHSFPQVSDSEDVNNLAYIQNVGYNSLLRIARAYIHIFESSPLHIDVVSKELFAISADDKTCPMKSTLLGAVKVIPKEFSNISARVIDIKDLSDMSVKILIRELKYTSQDIEVALRDGQRYISHIEPVNVQIPNPSNIFRTKGTYLVTGCNGGMGKLFSEYLASNFSANLILIGRSEFEPHFFNSLKEKGSQIMFIKSDVAQRESVSEGILKAISAFGCVNGVIHTAGAMDYYGAIVRRSAEDDNVIFAPKIKGTLNLWDSLKDQRLDFFVNCSSLSATTAPFGEVAYVAANIFLDKFAESKKESGVVISIQWCALQEIGGAVKSVKHLNAEQQVVALQMGITPQQAIQILLASIFLKIPNPFISTADLPSIIHAAREKEDQMSEVFPQTKLRERPALSTLYRDPNTETEKTLVSLVELFFGIQGVGIDDNFFELAGDSLKAMMLIKRIEKRFNISLTLKDFFELQTFTEIASKIESKKGMLQLYKTENLKQRKLTHEGATKYIVSIEKEPSKHLIPLNICESENTLFIVPGSQGFSDNYYELAQSFGKRFNIYGFQMMGSLSNENPRDSIEEIARENIAWVKEIQASGTYRFIGHSFGAHVAFEMIKQLEDSAQQIDFLAILDVAADIRQRNDRRKKNAIINQIISETCAGLTPVKMSDCEWDAITRETAMDRTLKELIPVVSYLIKKNVTIKDQDLDHILKLMWLRIHNECIDYSTNGLINSRTIVVKAIDEHHAPDNPSMGWQRYCSRAIMTFNCPGDHFSILKKRNAQKLVDFLETVS